MGTSAVFLRDSDGITHRATISQQPGTPFRVSLGREGEELRASTIYVLEEGGHVIENMSGALFGLHGRQYWLVER